MLSFFFADILADIASISHVLLHDGILGTDHLLEEKAPRPFLYCRIACRCVDICMLCLGQVCTGYPRSLLSEHSAKLPEIRRLDIRLINKVYLDQRYVSVNIKDISNSKIG